MTTSKFNTVFFGGNIRAVDVPPTVTGTGTVFPQFKLGSVTEGDAAGEFIYCGIALTAGQTLSEGQVVQYDNNFNATLLTTANAIRGAAVGVLRISPAFVAPAAGTYYLWVQRAGIGPANAASTAAAGNLANTTATAGTVDAPATATTGSKAVVGLYFAATNQAFTGTTTNGSTAVTGVNLTTLATELFVGQTVTGTGIPVSTTIAAIYAGSQSLPAGSVPVGAVGSPSNATVVLSNAATANGAGVTVTAAGILEAYVSWPFVDKTN